MNTTNHKSLSLQHWEILSTTSLAFYWQERIDVKLNQAIISCAQVIKQHFPQQVVDVICSYSCLVAQLAVPHVASHSLLNAVKKVITEHLKDYHNQSSKLGQHHLIDVYYGLDSGWDLAFVSEQTGLTIEQVIERHSQATYHVFANGFMPGFSYLGVVDNALKLARKQTPRVRIPKGAVAIAEQQTAIYPQASPGGWLILGQTSSPLLVPQTNKSCSLQPKLLVGDTVKFNVISKQQFQLAGGQVDTQVPA